MIVFNFKLPVTEKKNKKKKTKKSNKKENVKFV